MKYIEQVPDQDALQQGHELLYWLLANNPPWRGPLYWTQDQWDHANVVREALKSMAARMTRGKRFP